MTYFDDYKKRLTANGTNVGDTFTKASTNAINTTFKDSPGYVQATIDGVLTDIILQGDAGIGVHTFNKLAIFPPAYAGQIGSTVLFNGETWMILEFNESTLFPRGRLQKCNNTLKWMDGTTAREYPCYASNLVMSERNGEMILPHDEYMVMIKYDSITSTIKEDKRFIIGSRAYSVLALDDVSRIVSGKGILHLHLTSNVARTGDDMVNKVADNTKPAPNGGKLW